MATDHTSSQKSLFDYSQEELKGMAHKQVMDTYVKNNGPPSGMWADTINSVINDNAAIIGSATYAALQECKARGTSPDAAALTQDIRKALGTFRGERCVSMAASSAKPPMTIDAYLDDTAQKTAAFVAERLAQSAQAQTAPAPQATPEEKPAAPAPQSEATPKPEQTQAPEQPKPEPQPQSEEAPAPAQTQKVTYTPDTTAPTEPATGNTEAAPSPSSSAAVAAPETLTELYLQAATGQAGNLFSEESLKATLHRMVKKHENFFIHFPDTDIDKLAHVISTSSAEWLAQNTQALGDHPDFATIRRLSGDYARFMRRRITPQSSGSFGEKLMFGFVDPEEYITGVDEHGAILPYSGVNLQSISEALMTAQFADAPTKQAYLSHVATLERQKEFFDQGTPVTPEAAIRATQYGLMQTGYSPTTQNAVSSMVDEAFAPPQSNGGWLSKIWSFFVALFTGDFKNLFSGDYELRQHNSTNHSRAFDVYNRILSASPQELGYNPASGQEFSQWRAQLATDATGIEIRNNTVEFFDVNGTPRGLATALVGLAPDSTIPGTSVVALDLLKTTPERPTPAPPYYYASDEFPSQQLPYSPNTRNVAMLGT